MFLSVSECVAMRWCRDGMCEGPGLSLSMKQPWTSTKAQTEKDRQGRAGWDGVEGGLKVAQLAQG